MATFRRPIVWVVALVASMATPTTAGAQTAPAPLTIGSLTVTASLRTRVESWDWFDRSPDGRYTFDGSLFRAGLSQAHKKVTWQLEFAAPVLLGLPQHAVKAGAVGTLGLGGNYFSANGNRTNVAGLFVKQALLSFPSLAGAAGQSLQIGRMEFSEGAEVVSKHPTLAALKRDRIAQRLLGPFGFSHVGRSVDGIRYAFTRDTRNVTALAARPTRGVFDVEGWDELDVNLFYGAFTQQHPRPARATEWRVFGLGYQDYRQTARIDIGSAGGHVVHVADTRSGPVDLLVWGAAQWGTWRGLAHRAGSLALEGGWQPKAFPRLLPWIRAGYNVGSGDKNSADERHGTFYQVLPTPRLYARFPFFNGMNSADLFGTLILRPSRRLTTRADVHSLRLSNGNDLWYQGGGPFQNGTFGYAQRPSGGRTGLATLIDASADLTLNPHWSVGGYVGVANGGPVADAIYGAGSTARFGYVELVVRF